MMYIDNEVLEKMIMTIVEGFDRIEKKLDRMGRVKDFMNGDELLDNYDIARLLNVSLRTVAQSLFIFCDNGGTRKFLDFDMFITYELHVMVYRIE